MARGGRDVVVIGAGLGGLSAAIHLAADGHRVQLFEKNAHVGGKLNRLETGGFLFDLGPSILTLPSYFEELFRRHGKRMTDYLRIRPVLPHWRCFFEDGTRVDLYPDPDETVSRNPALTRSDAEDLRRFLEYSGHLYERTRPGYFDRGLDTLWQMIRFYGAISTLRDFDVFSTVDQGVRRHVRNPYLRDILNFFIKYVGSSPYCAPAVLNLLFYAQCAHGLWYVEGGMYNLALALRRLAAEAGVQIETSTEVTRLVARDRRVEAAELADGRTVKADIFVSNMEVIPAYERLLGEDRAFLDTLRKFEPACSGLIVHLGLSREYPQLAHHNFFFSRNPKKHFEEVFRWKRLPEDPTLYVVAPARTDPTQAPAGCENLKILPHIPHLGHRRPSPDEYAALRQRVLDKLERMGLKGLPERTVVEDTWTPERIEAQYYSNQGAIYGVVADRRKNMGLKAPKKSSRYANLYFVGGSVNPGGGMPMVVLSGRQVRDRIAEETAQSSIGAQQ